MAEVDPDQEAALRRLRAAFGFVQVLRVVDHHDQEAGARVLDDDGSEHSQPSRSTIAVTPALEAELMVAVRAAPGG